METLIETTKKQISIYAFPGLNQPRMFMKPKKKEISVLQVKQIVCNYFGIPTTVIDNPARQREIVERRQIVQALSKEFTKASLSEIGKETAGKDHATVLHSIKQLNNLSDTNSEYAAMITDLRNIIKQKHGLY